MGRACQSSPHLYMPWICSCMRQQLFLGFYLWISFFLQVIASCKCSSVLFQNGPRGTCLQIQTSGIVFMCSFLKMLIYICHPTSTWEIVMMIKYQNMKLLKHRSLFTLEVRVRTTPRSKPMFSVKTLFLTKLEQGLQKLRSNFQPSLKLQRHYSTNAAELWTLLKYTTHSQGKQTVTKPWHYTAAQQSFRIWNKWLLKSLTQHKDTEDGKNTCVLCSFLMCSHFCTI